MAGINWEAVNEVVDAIQTGDKQIFRQQDIATGSSEEFRFLIPTQENMGKVYFKPRTLFWISEKPYLSLETLGEDCPLIEEYDKARKSRDLEVKALLESRTFQKRDDYLFVALRMSITYSKDGLSVKDAKVLGDKAIIFACGKGVFSDINKSIIHPKNIRAGKGESLMHRELGRNITIEKTGSGLGTEYGVQLDPDSLDLSDAMYDKFYEETPDIMAYLERDAKDPEYLRAVIRNYLYGEDMPLDGESVEEEMPKKSKAKGKRTSLLDNIENLEDS